MSELTRIFRNLSLIGQLGFSLVTPLILCLLGAYWMNARAGAPLWIYIPALVLGLGSSFMTAWKVYLAAVRKNKKEEQRTAFNRHY